MGVRARIATEARVLLTGVMFLTRVPVPAWVGFDPDHLARSTAYFPAVGLLVGLVGALAFALGAALWPAFVAAGLSTAATVWVTGAFHEDALADSFDGFGGGRDRDQVLAIMKDSRVGSYGVVGVVLVVALKLGALTAIAAPGGAAAGPRVGRALVAAHVLGRWSSLPLIWHYPYVRETGGKSRPFAAAVTGARLAGGSVLAVLLAGIALAPFGAPRVLAIAVSALVVTAAGGRYFGRRLGGITGDCLGAANQVVELVTYLALAAARPA